MIEFKREETQSPPRRRLIRSRAIGLGGAGSNALDQIALDGIEEAELFCLDTDIRTLKSSTAHQKIQLGRELTRGLGSGGDPELGAEAAEEVEEQIREVVRGQVLVFVCVGLGGGTGSGAASLVCRLAREEGAFVTVFATMPFSFEGRRRIRQAQTALRDLEQVSDALITFDNDRMGELALSKDGIQQAFTNADKLISQSVRAVAALVSQRGLVQIGMDDLLAALKNPSSRCLFGHGVGSGKNRVQEALRNALRSPLLDEGRLLSQASSTLVHIVGGPTMTLAEVEQLMSKLNTHVHPDAHILLGMSVDEKMGDRLSVTVFSSLTLEELQRAPMVEDGEEEWPQHETAMPAGAALPATGGGPASAGEDAWDDHGAGAEPESEEVLDIDDDEEDPGEEDLGEDDKGLDDGEEGEEEIFDRVPVGEAPADAQAAAADLEEIEFSDEDEDEEVLAPEPAGLSPGGPRPVVLDAGARNGLSRGDAPQADWDEESEEKAPEVFAVPEAAEAPAPVPEASPFRLERNRQALEDEVELIEDESPDFVEEVVWTDDEAEAGEVELERNHPPGFGSAPTADADDEEPYPSPRQSEDGGVVPSGSAQGSAAPADSRPEPNLRRRARRDSYQEELELDPTPRGQFDDSKIPTVVDGENLDIPTYLRKKMTR
ncbi:MAG TPA: cell division protein FtsZ [Verrucomicrobiales bacterium]|nr:cell division protein FtsZ [Verrucomicrobiales bacterium]